MAQITADDLNGLGGDIRRLIGGLRPLLLEYDKDFHNYDGKTTEWCVTTACVLFVFYTAGKPPLFEKTLKGGGVATVVTGLPGSGKSTYAAHAAHGLMLHASQVPLGHAQHAASQVPLGHAQHAASQVPLGHAQHAASQVPLGHAQHASQVPLGHAQHAQHAMHVPPVDVDTINEFASFGVLTAPWHGPCSLVCEFLIHLYMRHGYDFCWVVIIQDAGFYAKAFAMFKRYGYTVNIVNMDQTNLFSRFSNSLQAEPYDHIATCHERLRIRQRRTGQSIMSLEDLTRLQFSIDSALLMIKLQNEKKLIGAPADPLQVIADNVKKLPTSRLLRTMLYRLVQSQIVDGVAAPHSAFYECLYCARVEGDTAHTLVEPVTLACGHSFCKKCVGVSALCAQGALSAASCCFGRGAGGQAALSKPLSDLIAHTTPNCADLVLSHEATHAMVEKTGNGELLEISKALRTHICMDTRTSIHTRTLSAKIYNIIALQADSGPDSAFYSLLMCAICLCTCDTPVTLPCGHLFCKKCIEAARASAPQCPTCRASIVISAAEIRPTFLLCSLIDVLC